MDASASMYRPCQGGRCGEVATILHSLAANVANVCPVPPHYTYKTTQLCPQSDLRVARMCADQTADGRARAAYCLEVAIRSL